MPNSHKNRYALIRQKPYCCVPASLSAVLNRRSIRHASQAAIGYELGLTLPPEKRLRRLFPKARFATRPPGWGYGTRVGIKRYSINSYFKRNRMPLKETYYPPERIGNAAKLISESMRRGDDVLACFNNKRLYGGIGDWGHVCVIEGISSKKAKLLDPDNPPYHNSVDLKRLVAAMRYHGRKNRGGLWVISEAVA
jgi:hypothetical protein